MTNLERIEAKIFASNAPINQIGQFGSARAGTKLETNDVSTIQALPAYTEGWSAAVISDRNYPVLQEMNGVMKNMSYQTAYIMQKGIPEWNSETIYYVGDICKGVGEGKIYISLADENIGNTTSNATYWEEFSAGGGLEIGDIGIAPLGIDETQGKRRYLNGQIIIQDQFVSFTNKVKKAVELYPSLACTESEWQTTVTMTAFGQCGKFVIDDEAGTIRLPKITGFIQGLTDLASLGEAVGAGLPNINASLGNIVVKASEAYAGGAFNVTQYLANNVGTGSSNYYNYAYFDFYASRSNATYGSSHTVQPESIRYPYFIQVATGVEESVDVTREIELNNPYSLGDSKYSPVALDNISWLKSEGQWNAKAVYPAYYDWILTNANNGVADFKLSTDTYDDYSWVVNTADETFRLPLLNGSELKTGIKSKDITIQQSGNTYIAPANGWFVVEGVASGSSAYVDLVGNVSSSSHCQTSGHYLKSYVPVSRGSSCILYYTDLGQISLRFIYARGNGSLYFYIGDTVQNANLINAGRIEENVASIKSNVDAILRGSQNPDYSRAISIGQNYTCPSDGYIVLKTVVAGNGDQPVAYVNNVLISQFQNICPNAVRWGGGMFKVSKGDYIAQTWSEALFIPEKGV